MGIGSTGSRELWGALRNVYPDAAEQHCWTHRILNVLDKLPKREHAQAQLVLCHIPYAETRNGAERLMSSSLTWCHQRRHQAAAEAP